MINFVPVWSKKYQSWRIFREDVIVDNTSESLDLLPDCGAWYEYVDALKLAQHLTEKFKFQK